jgi:hypothetical protein
MRQVGVESDGAATAARLRRVPVRAGYTHLHAAQHAWCGAHPLRDLKAVFERRPRSPTRRGRTRGPPGKVKQRAGGGAWRTLQCMPPT